MSLNRIKLVVFDCDGTLTTGPSSWQLLHEAFGTLRQAEINAELYKSGKISYYEWAKRDVELWRGKKLDKAEPYLKKIKLVEGSEWLFQKLSSAGIKTVVISAGLDPVVQRFVKPLNPYNVFCNRLLTKDGVILGSVELHVDYKKKGEIVRLIMDKMDLCDEQVIAIGDSEADVSMFHVAGMCIAFNPSDAYILPHAKAVVRGNMFHLYTILKRNIKNL
jgi:phosphoserine phosphatase